MEEHLNEPCPCGAGPTFAECCASYMNGEGWPETAEKLMRSRYSAYVVGNIDWIQSTHDANDGEEVDVKATERWSKESNWLGLDIVRTEAGGESDDTGVVEFRARYELGGHELSHHEVARFRREQGKWIYADGEMVKAKPVVREQPKVGRNEPCPCGSGQKYKKCHGRAA